jgi:peptidoglycan-associated lipoprotein
MNVTMSTTTRVLMTALLCTAAVACSKKVKEAPPPMTTPSTAPSTETGPAAPGAYGPGDLDTDACLRTRVVYFDYDQDTVRPEFQAAMACHAKYLRDRPSARMTLEGNTDERGSREYNRALGERRGMAVSSSLQANGGSASQMEATSYGEERPVCTDSNESCWAKNRRVEIVYTAK